MKFTNISSANDPNAAKVATWMLPITCEAIAKLIGTTTAARMARRSATPCGSRERSQRHGRIGQLTWDRQSDGTRSRGPGTPCSTG